MDLREATIVGYTGFGKGVATGDYSRVTEVLSPKITWKNNFLGGMEFQASLYYHCRGASPHNWDGCTKKRRASTSPEPSRYAQ